MKTTIMGSTNLGNSAGKTVDLGAAGVTWVKLSCTTGIQHVRLTADGGSAPTDPAAVLVAAAPSDTPNVALLAIGAERTFGIPGDGGPGGPRWRYLEVWSVAAGQVAYQAGE